MNARFLKNIDIWVLVLMLSMACLGSILIWTATDVNSFWFKQMLFIFIGTTVLLGVSLFKPFFWYNCSFYLYFGSLSLLFLIDGNADRWIKLPFGLYFQPSEILKISVILVLARVLSQSTFNFFSFKSFVLPTILFFVPFILVLKQPDLSTSIVLVVLFLSMLHFAGLTFIQILILVSPILSTFFIFGQWLWIPFFIVLVILMWYSKMKAYSIAIFSILNIVFGYSSLIIWNEFLKSYQKDRIFTFLNPWNDPYGRGYQIIQSKITIGSGGFWGKGLGQGSQTNFGFLPEQHTDFIFSVLSEQFGFIGSMSLLVLFFAFNYRLLKILKSTLDPFKSLVIVGITTFFVFHMFFNVAMTQGLVPVTGLPLPFLSYGGSFMLICFFSVGLVFSMKNDN